MKKCRICEQNLDEINYHKNSLEKDGLDRRCKLCCKKYKKQHRLDNLEKYKKRRNDAYKKIKDSDEFKKKKADYDKLYAFKNREKIKKREKLWHERTKEIRNNVARKWQNNKRKTDIRYRLNTYISNYIRDCLKSRKNGRSFKKFINYSISDLISHIESKFTNGMTWDNYGEWHIDHIVPVSSFDFSDEKQITNCWSLDNLQPLWATTQIAIAYGEDSSYIGNIEKGNKIIHQ